MATVSGRWKYYLTFGRLHRQRKSVRFLLLPRPKQGCQMVCFQTKNPDLRNIFRASDFKMVIYFMAIWNIL
jgi:hypothetical protein